MSNELSIVELLKVSPGVAALALVFWLVLKQIPADRASRDQTVEKFISSNAASQAHIEKVVKEFCEVNAKAHEDCSEERDKDREARHAFANALTTLGLKIHIKAIEEGNGHIS